LTAFLVAVAVGLVLGGAMWHRQALLLLAVFTSVMTVLALRRGWLNRGTWI